MRNIYESRHKEIQDLRKARNKELFVDVVYKMSKQINQRFYRLEKANKGMKESAYRYAQKETGKEKPRYSVNKNKLEELDVNELYKLALQLNQKIISKTSTLPGLKEINKKRLEMTLQVFNDGTVTEDEKKQFSHFLSMGGGELMNNKFLDSYQIREDWYNYSYKGGASSEEFIETYRSFMKKENTDYAKIRRSLINLHKRG